MDAITEDSLPNLCGSINEIFHHSKELACIADDHQVLAFKFVTPGNDAGVVKFWSARRVAVDGAQVGAELRASAVFGEVLDEPSPLMALLLEQSAYPKGSTITVYPYAGPSADHMLRTDWAQLTPQQREPLSKKLAISGLMMIQLLESVPAGFGGPKLHRDGKLSNWCYNQTGDYFVCIDFGGFCSTNLADWHGIWTAKYLDSCFARVIAPGASNSPPVRVIHNVEEWRSNTTRSLDLYLLALAVIELYLGRLPAAIDIHQYGPHRFQEYLAAVCDYQWANCVELANASPEMMEFLLWCTAPNPADRPPTAAAALQHEWLADQVAAVEQAVAEAAPAWAATNHRLREALAGCAAPAQAADLADSSNADSSNADSSSEASSCSLDDFTDDRSSGQLWSDHGSSDSDSSSSTTSSSSITSSECYDDAACQHQDSAAPVDYSNASSSSETSNCRLADCTVVITSEQLKPSYSIGGGSMICTKPSAESDPGGSQAASPLCIASNIPVSAGQLLLPRPMVCSNANVEGLPAYLSYLLHRDASRSQRCCDTARQQQDPSCLSSSKLGGSRAAAAAADWRLQQHQRQRSTSNILPPISQLQLPPLVCSNANVEGLPSYLAGLLRRSDASRSQRCCVAARQQQDPSCLSSSKLDGSGAAAAAAADWRLQQHQRQRSTSNILAPISSLQLPPLVCSNANVEGLPSYLAGLLRHSDASRSQRCCVAARQQQDPSCLSSSKLDASGAAAAAADWRLQQHQRQRSTSTILAPISSLQLPPLVCSNANVEGLPSYLAGLLRRSDASRSQRCCVAARQQQDPSCLSSSKLGGSRAAAAADWRLQQHQRQRSTSNIVAPISSLQLPPLVCSNANVEGLPSYLAGLLRRSNASRSQRCCVAARQQQDPSCLSSSKLDGSGAAAAAADWRLQQHQRQHSTSTILAPISSLQLPPLVCSNANVEGLPSYLAGLLRRSDASRSQRCCVAARQQQDPSCLSSSKLDGSGAAAAADWRLQQHQLQRSTSNILAPISSLQLPPLVCSNANVEGLPSYLAGLLRRSNASRSQRCCVAARQQQDPSCLSSSKLDGSGAAAAADWRLQQHQRQRSTSNILAPISSLQLPPLVCSTADVEGLPAYLSHLLHRSNASRSPCWQRCCDTARQQQDPSCHSSSKLDSPAAAAAAAAVDKRHQQHQQQHSTSNTFVSISKLQLPPLVCSGEAHSSGS